MLKVDPSNSTSLERPVALSIAPSFVLWFVKTILVIWFGFGGYLVAEEAETQKTILVLGDSISAAYRIDTELGWVSLLREKLRAEREDNWRVVNASISGNTTLDGLTRIDALLIDHKPDIVILELGANDGLRGYPITDIQDNLNTLVTKAQSSGSQVIVAGMQIPPNYGPLYTEKFMTMFYDVAADHDAGLIPFLMQDVAGVDEHMQEDLLHPTISGQPRMLANVWPVLKPFLTKETNQTN